VRWPPRFIEVAGDVNVLITTSSKESIRYPHTYMALRKVRWRSSSSCAMPSEIPRMFGICSKPTQIRQVSANTSSRAVCRIVDATKTHVSISSAYPPQQPVTSQRRVLCFRSGACQVWVIPQASSSGSSCIHANTHAGRNSAIGKNSEKTARAGIGASGRIVKTVKPNEISAPIIRNDLR